MSASFDIPQFNNDATVIADASCRLALTTENERLRESLGILRAENVLLRAENFALNACIKRPNHG